MATVGVLIASGFEQADMTAICTALAEAGHDIRVISTKKHDARAWDNTRWNGALPVDAAVTEANLDGLAAIVIPGGLIAADTLRSDEAVIRLVTEAIRRGMPTAAMGHAGWVLLETGLVSGRIVTSHPAIRTDLINAGADWRNEAAVVHRGLVTGRHGHDCPAFIQAVVAALP